MVIRSLIRIGVLALLAVIGVSLVVAVRARRSFVPVDDPEADEIALMASFAPLGFRSRASSFRGGQIEMWFGGGIVDLRGATLAPDGALLRVRTVFGGGQLVVPEAWRVELDVRGMGGAVDARDRAPISADAPVLVIEALSLFGGFQVVSELPAEVEQQLEAGFGG